MQYRLPQVVMNSGKPIRRREFLALASAGAAAALAGWPENSGKGEAPVVRPTGETRSLDTGGIAAEYFEKARERASAIVAKLTLSEKISQLGSTAPAVPRVGLPAFKYSGEALHGLVQTGPVTSFPLPLALGCSWNRSLMHRVFTAVSDEIWGWHKKTGESQAMFSPATVNMGTRDPRYGRIAENYSEDPYLVAEMAVSTIQGMQGTDARYLKTLACAKHFVAAEDTQASSVAYATVDPRSFWEYYARGFEACVRQGQVFTVMSAYLSVNGIPATASRFLLTDLLRGQWGFRGYVVSDCDSVDEISRTLHFVSTHVEAAALAINAGCDINCGETFQKYLREAVDKMLVSESALDRALIPVITGRILLGELDPPEQNPYSRIAISCLDCPAHRELAREAARQSIVLFKNQTNTLPLDRSKLKKIAVIGPMADVCNLGNYSGKPQFLVSPLQGIKDYLNVPGQEKGLAGTKNSTVPARGNIEVVFTPGCSVVGGKDPAQFSSAVNAAREADVALVFVGADEQVDREGQKRDYLHLPGAQHELVQAVYAANPRTILVISSNCPVAVNWEQDNLPAIVGGLFLGEQQGHALADVLFGDYNPGGKTSTTWYRRVEDLPDFQDYNVRHGRTYMYFRGEPLYPFGHGLSYTTFAYRNLRTSGKALEPGGKVTLSLEVSNTGHLDGDEIVQVYVQSTRRTVERPLRQLVNFERVHVKAGETRTVSFELAHSHQAFRYWDATNYKFVVEPGPVDVLIAASSVDIRVRGQVELTA